MASTPRVRNFESDLAASKTDPITERIIQKLRGYFPTAQKIHPSGNGNDRAGADFWIEFGHGQFRSVDAKIRSEDWSLRGRPEIALEIWANLSTRKPGWALDNSKLTDYVLFFWKDSDRALLVDFRHLVAVTRANVHRWTANGEAATQTTAAGAKQYYSTVIYVSSDELLTEIQRWQRGEL